MMAMVNQFGQPIHKTLKDRLSNHIEENEENLSNMRKALAALEAVPGLEELLQYIRQ